MIRIFRENKTLREMLAGLVAAGVVVTVICLIFSKDILFNCIGLWIGIVGAAFMVIHMAYTIEDVVLLDEKSAVGYSRKMTFIRYIVVCILVVLTGVTKIGSPVMCVIGILLLKAGAYLQPLVHRITGDRDNK